MKLLDNCYKKLVFSFIIYLTLTILGSNTAYARSGNSVNLNNYNVDIKLTKEGNLVITEDLDYYFDGKFNGAFKDISIKKTAGISDIKVYQIDKSVEIPFKRVTDAKNGDFGVFEILKQANDIFRVKMYYPSENENRSFKIKYTLESVAISYNDIGELYYNLWDKGYDIRVENMDATIHLPSPVDLHNLKAFVHGSLDYRVDIIDNKTIYYNAKNLKSSKYVSVRVLFPKEIIPLTKNLRLENSLENILQDENNQKQMLEDKSEAFKKRRNIAIILFFGLLLFDFLILIVCTKKFKREEKHYTDIAQPKICSPAVMGKFYTKALGGKHFAATILDLSRKGCLEVAREDDEKSKEDYRINILNGSTDNLLMHERYFISWLYKCSNYSGSIKMKELEKLMKSDRMKFYTDFKEWERFVQEEVKNSGYIDSSKNDFVGILVLLSFVQSPVIIFIIVQSLLGLGILLFSLIFIILLIALVQHNRLSDMGYDEKVKWKRIKSCFECSKFNSIGIGHPLDEYLPYMIALNVSVYSLKKFRTFILDNDQYQTYSWLINYFAFDNFTRNTSFAYYVNSSSFTASTGGFSAGGGGGAGGGGAGGF